MSFVKPPPFHVRIRGSPQTLEITVSRNSRWYRRLLALLTSGIMGINVLVAVSFAVIAVGYLYTYREESWVGGAFTPLLSCMTGVSGIVIGVGVAITWGAWRDFLAVWMKQEVVTASGSRWQIERFWGPWKRAYHFSPHNISRVHRAGHSQAKTWQEAMAGMLEFMAGLQPRSGLVFRYKHTSVNFARAATEAEAHRIMEALRGSFPDLCQPKSEAQPPVAAPLSQARWHTWTDSDRLVIRLPRPRRSKAVILWAYFVLLPVTVFIGCLSLLLVVSDFSGASPIALITWVTLVTVLIILPALGTLREFLWLIRGNEILTITQEGIALSYEHLALSPERSFFGESISGLRLELRYAATSNFPSFFRWPGATGAIAFDYGAGTYRFGQDLTPAEANALVRQILDRFPQYGRDDMIPVTN